MCASRTCRWLTALLLGAGLTGCRGASPQAYPPDPLLASKRPVEVKAKSAPPASVAAAAPVVPPSRAELIAANTPRPVAPSADRPTPDEPPLPPRLRPVSAEPPGAAPAGPPPSGTSVRASSE
jgi:hypothetical protein